MAFCYTGVNVCMSLVLQVRDKRAGYCAKCVVICSSVVRLFVVVAGVWLFVE